MCRAEVSCPGSAPDRVSQDPTGELRALPVLQQVDGQRLAKRRGGAHRAILMGIVVVQMAALVACASAPGSADSQRSSSAGSGQALDGGPSARAAESASPTPMGSLMSAAASNTIAAPDASVPNLSVQNGTTLDITLVVNGQAVGTFAAHSWTWSVVAPDISSLPWAVEVRSPSGRALATMDVPIGVAQSTVGPDGDVTTDFKSATADLSCGRIRVLVGWQLTAPPPFGAVPLPSLEGEPGPTNGQPGVDCAP